MEKKTNKQTCPACQGSGVLVYTYLDHLNGVTDEDCFECEFCNGTGELLKTKFECNNCPNTETCQFAWDINCTVGNCLSQK